VNQPYSPPETEADGAASQAKVTGILKAFTLVAAMAPIVTAVFFVPILARQEHVYSSLGIEPSALARILTTWGGAAPASALGIVAIFAVVSALKQKGGLMIIAMALCIAFSASAVLLLPQFVYASIREAIRQVDEQHR